MKTLYLLSLATLSLAVSSTLLANNTALYQVLKSASGICLGVQEAHSADNTPVLPLTCDSSGSQQWRMDKLGRLHPKNAPEKCLEVGSNVTYEKTAYITQCNEEMYQRWRWSQGTIQNQYNPYMVLDYYADRQLIGVWQFHGGQNQQWQWVKSDNPTTPDKPNKPTNISNTRDIIISVNTWGEYNNRAWEGQSDVREKGDFKLYNAVIYLDKVEGYDLGNDKPFTRGRRSFDPSNIMVKASTVHNDDRRDDQLSIKHSKQLLMFFKEYFDAIVAKEKKTYPNKSLRFSFLVHGHGSAGRGALFERRLKSDDTRELLKHIIAVSGQKLAMLDLSSICNEATWANISNLAPYADYIAASEFLSGGMKSDWKGEKYVRFLPENHYPDEFDAKLDVKDILVNQFNRIKKYNYNKQVGPYRAGGSTQKSKTLFESKKVDQFVCSLKGIQGDLIPQKHHKESIVHDVKKYLLDLKAHGTNDQNRIDQALKAYDNMAIYHVTNESTMPDTWSQYRSHGLSMALSWSMHGFTNPVGKDLFDAFSEVMHQKPQCK
ncbi:ricin-type beta-trefoil lectin domain protein [Spartinivicinus poritis]|uniref:Ricin-type beta-trefoil lectin domain protein n=1 Tax=Spartinivicinus poritis TaxID=2994640 RepID=A0ABT5UFA6_9GAMM|nr:ricin-type beta-trefoil lectin domain protein [Spartinivicinus sp. A2-2]MDE1465065.1 ricin-type beta-trefoil lectin domain protein [Spartinivicinus sp. A2-2]